MRQISATGSEASVRGHRIAIDRPESKGGADSGPMGGELFLAGVGGCFMSNLLAAINARAAAVHNVHTEVSGVLTDGPTRFTAIELRVTADCEDPELLAHLVTLADRGCITMNTLRGHLDLRVSIAPST